MPAVIDQNTLDIRITWLEIERHKLEIKQSRAEGDRVADLQRKIDDMDAKIEECQDWLKILNQDPGWGDLINIKGRKVPKMPTFKDNETMARRLEDPEDWAMGMDHEETARAREFNMKNNAQEAAFVMDGAGPVKAMLDEGYSEEEILDMLRKDTWDKTLDSTKTPPSNDGS
jgi:hypothetical protein